jgi:hypothetical protein
MSSDVWAMIDAFTAEVDLKAEGLDRIATVGHTPRRFAPRELVVHLAPPGTTRPLCRVRASGWQPDPGGRRLCARCVVRLLEASSSGNTRPEHAGQTPESGGTRGFGVTQAVWLTGPRADEGGPTWA